MTQTPKRHWLEYAITTGVLLISAVSLWVAIGTEDANRQMVEASSWPFLQVNSSNGDGQGHSILLFSISNGGVGPAKVKSLEVFWRGTAYSGAAALASACCGYKPAPIDIAKTGGPVPESVFTTARMAKTVIRAGDWANFITYPLTVQDEAVWRNLDAERRTNISFRLCYCSVFDECWTDSFTFQGDSGPRRVETCAVPRVPYDQ